MAKVRKRGRKVPPQARRKLLAPAQSAAARLRKELAEARAQQAATAEILKVISESPTDTQPVFDRILASCERLFAGRRMGISLLGDDGKLHLGAYRGPGAGKFAKLFPMPADETTGAGAAIVKRRVMHYPDVLHERGVPPGVRSGTAATGTRSVIFAPLLWEGTRIGAIFVGRSVAVPFSGKEIELLKAFAHQAAIAIKNVRLFNETKEALERQTTTAEILKVIASSPTDVQPVFDAIAKSAQRLIRARYANVVRRVDEMLHLVAYTVTEKGAIASLKKLFPTKLTGQAATGKAVLTGKPAGIVDVETDPAYSPSFRKRARVRGWRSLLAVPMLHKGRAIGAINVTRPEPGEFSHQQIKLLQAFADQAVIAIENVRLFNETKEALERQTATAEILTVISSSPTDLQPVFDAILKSACALCDAHLGILNLLEAERLRTRAHCGGTPEFVRWLYEREPFDPRDYPGMKRMLGDCQPYQVPDQKESKSYRDGLLQTVKMVELGGSRTFLCVPLVKEGKVMGSLGIYRPEVRPFTERQVALVRTFADQAVIAIENVRLFNELEARNRDVTEALEQQTASARILKAISASPTNTQPVLDAIAGTARRLFDVPEASIALVRNDRIELVASDGLDTVQLRALRASFPRPLDLDSIVNRVVVGGALEHIADANDPDVPEYTRQTALSAGIRSLIGVPLMREGKPIGGIFMSRARAGGFSDKQIALTRSFADQAVIAIENARLFNETKEALERQTATAEILRVISESPTETQPVFDAIVASAARLFDCDTGIQMRDGDWIHLKAAFGFDEESVEKVRNLFPLPFDPEHNLVSRAIGSCSIVGVKDSDASDALALSREAGRRGNFRAITLVPLIRKGEAIGTLALARAVPGFELNDKQRALVQTFAGQAVIAIENVRLFNETKEALEHQTATAEVLQVISSSVADAKPVFDKILSSCRSLFAGSVTTLGLLGDDDIVHIHLESVFANPGAEAVRAAHPRPARDSIYGYVAHKRRVFYFPDVQNGPDVPEGLRSSAALIGANYSAVYAPLMWEGRGIGTLCVAHVPPAPFSEKEIKLLKTFADQAAIAIQNARLFNETKEALERQTATAEILKVISRSPTEVRPVFYAICRSAAQLFGCRAGISIAEGGRVALKALAMPDTPETSVEVLGIAIPAFEDAAVLDQWRNALEALLGRLRAGASANWSLVRCVATREVVAIADTEAPEADEADREAGRSLGVRSITQVPLVRDGAGIGVIGLAFPEPGVVLNDKQRALVQTFADQAVIAIENVRLFKELEARNREVTAALERQTATAEVLRVISGSLTDARPVFEAIARACQRLFGGKSVLLALAIDGMVVPQAGVDEAGGSLDVNPIPPFPIDRGSASGVAILDGRTLNLADLTKVVEELPRMKQLGLRMGFHSGLWVPLRRAGEAIGILAIARRTTGAFTEQEVTLAETFADQAVIAIENVRLFNETKEALERQTATAEVLQVISNSVADARPVFTKILQSCQSLFAGDSVALALLGDDDMMHLHLFPEILVPDMPDWRRQFRRSVETSHPRPARDSIWGYAAHKRQVLNFPDVANGPDVPQGLRKSVELVGTNYSVVFAPLLWEGRGVGALNVVRVPPAPFSEKEISLLKTFADQAVIAIQNARLFNETKEALERQTATAEILKVISRSPTEVRPVFYAICRSAAQLFGCRAGISIADGGRVALKALAMPDTPETSVEVFGVAIPAFEDAEVLNQWRNALEALARTRGPTSATSSAARCVATREVVAISDTEAPEVDEIDREVGRALRVRSFTQVPLVRDGVGIGVIGIAFREPGAVLNDKQRALLRTFADQAVIAIENVRLFNETKEALERQTATAEVLQVISSSVADTAPVFDKIIRSCERLFGVGYVNVALLREDGMIDLVQNYASADLEAGDLAHLKVIQAQFPRPARDSIHGYAIHRREVLHYPDVANGPGVPEGLRASVTLVGRPVNYAALYAPMLWEGKGIGAIALHRIPPAPFAEKDIRLLKTFADQAVIAIQNARLFNETKEALERQTATAEILKVIASSPSDVQPVFDAIAKSALHLVEGRSAAVTRVVGDSLHLVALTTTGEAGDDALRAMFPMPASFGAVGEAIATRQPIFIADTEAAPASSAFQEMARARGYRSVLFVPMLRKDAAIGTISVTRKEPGPFTEHQISLLQTFADQAVIAIENVRLFNETKEALERQTATAEILNVISRSNTDTKPVFDAIARAAQRVFGGLASGISLVEGNSARVVAMTDDMPEDEARRERVMPLNRETAHARAIVDRAIVNIGDTQAPDAPKITRKTSRQLGFRAIAVAPIMTQDEAIGAIGVARSNPGAFNPNQLGLLQTFADQAAIAIENVRLFTETKEALERQTATAEILKVIAASPADVQPVFEAIARSAHRVFGRRVAFQIVRDGALHLGAADGFAKEDLDRAAALYPMPLDRADSRGLRAIRGGNVVETPDTEAPGTPQEIVAVARAGGFRSLVSVPLLREDELLGLLSLSASAPQPKLQAKQIELLKTFADQAVIAIENVRLFKELQQRVRQLTALGEVGQAISSTLDVEQVLRTIVARAVQLTGLDGGAIYEYDEVQQIFLLRGGENVREEILELNRNQPIRMGDGFIGRAATTRAPVQVPDLEKVPQRMRARDVLLQVGARALLAVPLVREDHVLGALAVIRNAPGEFAPEVIALLETFATQSAIAIQNARLFREIEEKGRLLQVASQHKSQFLASMSHELRTPLNAILGFNEMLLGQVYGEVPADMQEPMQDIQKSGKHLLRLINNVLDLAKIEAGRMELSLADYSVQDTVASVHATLRPLAAEKGLEFVANVPEDIPLAHGDSGRLAQCLMNLAGNSLKFTKAGKVEISVEAKGDLLVYKVVDTGVGIPPDKIGSLFTEFKQTDATIASEYGGTGLGLSISKKFVEMHGGRVWVESELGKGSAFIIEVPLRVTST